MVSMLTSTKGFASPRSATAAKTAAGDGHTVMSSRGNAQSTTPTVMSVANRCRPARAMATSPPRMAPIPSTESRYPTPSAPMPRMSTAITTRNTTDAPSDDRLGSNQQDDHREVAVCGNAAEALSHLHHEALRSPHRLRSGAPEEVTSSAGTDTPITRSVDHANVATLRRNTTSMLVAEISSAPRAGSDEEREALDGARRAVRCGSTPRECVPTAASVPVASTEREYSSGRCSVAPG